MEREDYALVVGISRYPLLTDLAGPVWDAVEFWKWLRCRAKVPKENIHFIATPAKAKSMNRKNARPILQQIREAFRSILDHEDECGKVGRRLYLYMAGHGCAPQFDDVVLLMADAGGRDYTGFSGVQHARWFRTAAKFEEIVLIMDCCRDEFSSPSLLLPPKDEPSPDARDVRFFSAFATQPYSKTKEKPIPPRNRVRGLFTHALLAAFELANPDPHGVIMGTAIKEYVINYMSQLTQNDNRQKPQITAEKEEDIKFWKAEPDLKLPVQIRLPISCCGSLQIENGNHEIVWSDQLQPNGIVQLELRPGLYRVNKPGLKGDGFFKVIGYPREVIYVEF